MSRTERNEWIERAKQRVLDNAKQTDQAVKEIMFLFDEAAWQMETDINAMFQRYASDNGLTEAEASRFLSSEEYSRWRKGIDAYLEEAEGDSKTLLELNTLAAKSRISRKEQMLSSIYRTMITLSRDTETKLTDLLGDLYKTNYYRSCYDVQSIFEVGFHVSKVDEKMLFRILRHPWSGKNYSQALWENTDKLAVLAKRELTLGFMSGSSIQKMAKEINDIMGKGRYAAERLVRTESSYFSNQGDLDSYKELGIAEYIYMGGGCDDCLELNGKSFLISEAEPGLNFPPMHPNCKCTSMAKPKRDLFQDREGVNPLKDNPKFEEWKKKYVHAEKESSKPKYDNIVSVINRKQLSSADYRKRYDSLPEMKKIQRKVASNAKKILKHRSGTDYEDLVFIDSKTGKTMVRNDYNVEKQVIPSKAMKKMVKEATDYTIIAIHNHPASSVPSLSDLISAKDRKYKYGIAAGHDGSIYKYSVFGELNEVLADGGLDLLERVKYITDEEEHSMMLDRALRILKDSGVEMEVL